MNIIMRANVAEMLMKGLFLNLFKPIEQALNM
jgi:hypothetical protein